MNDSIIVYSLPSCGMCKALKMELTRRGFSFQDIQDVEVMSSLGIHSAPVLSVNGKLYKFKEAMQWIKTTEVNN